MLPAGQFVNWYAGGVVASQRDVAQLSWLRRARHVEMAGAAHGGDGGVVDVDLQRKSGETLPTVEVPATRVRAPQSPTPRHDGRSKSLNLSAQANVGFAAGWPDLVGQLRTVASSSPYACQPSRRSRPAGWGAE